MYVHNFMNKKWKPIKKFDFRDCRKPLRFPLDDEVKIRIKTPHVPSKFIEKPDFEKALIMERFKNKVEMLLDGNEIIKGFKAQEYINSITENTHAEELKNKFKTLNENIARYSIPKEQADRLKSELLKEMMLEKNKSNIQAVNSTGNVVNRLGSIRTTGPAITTIDHDDVGEEIDKAVEIAEAETGVTLPEEIKNDEIVEQTTRRAPDLTRDTEDKLNSDLFKVQLTPGVLLKRIILIGGWIEFKGVVGIDVRTKRYTLEQIENIDSEIKKEWFKKLLDATNEEINKIFKVNHRLKRRMKKRVEPELKKMKSKFYEFKQVLEKQIERRERLQPTRTTTTREVMGSLFPYDPVKRSKESVNEEPLMVAAEAPPV